MKRFVRAPATGLVLAATLAAGCGSVEGGERLEVFAAASLRDALTEVAGRYHARTGIEPVLHFGSSGLLAVQIERGAHADVFFSAGDAEMERLERAGLIEPGSRRELLSNQLVVVVPAGAGSIADPRQLCNEAIRLLALANPGSVPAGRYARRWLESRGLWKDLEERVLPCIDVRAALAAVEHGGADAGLVYRTDAAITGGVEIAYAVPDEQAPGIVYPAAVVAGSARAQAAHAFLEHLRSPEARAVFERHGFRALDAP